MIIVVIVIIILWIRSYMSFKSKMKFKKSMVSALLEHNEPTGDYLVRLGTAYMNAQQYANAINCYYKVIKGGLYCSNPDWSFQALENNIEFCKNPCVGYSGGQNINESWLHNFLLVKFGGRRRIMLTDDDYLLTEDYMRRNNI